MGHVGGWPEASSLPTRTRVTPGTRAKSQTVQASPPALGLHVMVKTTCCSWPCVDVADVQETVDRAAAAPLGGPQAAPTSNTRAPGSSQFTLQDVRVRAISCALVDHSRQHTPATHRRHTHTLTSSPRCSSPGATRSGQSLRHAYTHVPSPHIGSLCAVLGA